MLGLIWFNLRYKNTKISDKHYAAIIRRLKRSTIGYKLFAVIAILIAAFVSAQAVMLGEGKEIQELKEVVFMGMTLAQVLLIGSGIVFAFCSYIVFFAKKAKVSAANILIKRSTELIKQTFEEKNLDSKSVIISNLANGRELGFSSDSAIVAIIPKRNELSVFEMFVDFIEIDNKKYPIFKNDKSHVVKVDGKDLLSISEYFERGNYVPKPVKDGIAVLVDNKKTLIEYGMDIEEVVEPQENTVIELMTVGHRFSFRSYKFKEILSGVYTDLKTKQDYTAIMQENAELKKQVQRYKSKLIEGSNE